MATDDEKRWLRRLRAVLESMPEELQVAVTETGGVMACRRDESRTEIGHLPGEFRIYPLADRSGGNCL